MLVLTLQLLIIYDGGRRKGVKPIERKWELLKGNKFREKKGGKIQR